jgi:CBS domain-containing protein
VADFMTRSPFSLPGHALAYEAVLAMVSRGIRHVVVEEDGNIVGVVSERDLFSMQRLGLGEIVTEIRLADSIALLVDVAAAIRRLTRLLVAQGVAAEHLTSFVSVLNDRLCQRIIEIERKRHAWDRIRWCWLAFGSEGRLEQTISTDQDNGIVFDGGGRRAAAATRDALVPFARAVNDALDACGFPLCKGNVMASNPRFCQSLDEWKETMHGWLDTPEPKALLDASICFDFRALAGDADLANALREWLLALTRVNPAILRHMPGNAQQPAQPLGKVRDFVTEDVDGAPHTVNLKLYGARPFIDCARVYALAHGIAATNTADRLRGSRAGTGMSESEIAAMVDGFYLIQRLRMRAQIDISGPGDPRANRIDPDALNEFERQTLKEAFRQGRKLQSRLLLDYQL